MDELVPPVVTTKPARGREMQTTTIPTDMFDTMRMMTAKKTLGGEDVSPELQKPTDGTAEYYHEGYIDGKKYLVPDSNLEAMKDIINFKMRPRRSTRYKHQTSYEISDYDHFRGKLDGLFAKLDNIQDLHSDLSEENLKEPAKVISKPEEKLERSEEESEDKYEDQDSKYKSEDEESEDEFEDETSEDVESNEEMKQESDVTSEEESDVHSLRFLVSGHFKKDQKPIYIIQEYNGEPDIFKNQKADFSSKQQDGNVDVNISGKFFNENMLEESDGKPVALKTKPDKIKIEIEKSKVYNDYFKDIYNMKNVDISFKGEFIKSKVTNRITPFLKLGVEKRASNLKIPKSPNHERKELNPYNTNMDPTTVLVYEPKYYTSPFSLVTQDINCGDIEETSAKEYLQSKNNNKPFTETDPALNDESSHQIATHFFSSSYIGKECSGEGIVNETMNTPFKPLLQSSSKQSDLFSIKESAKPLPVSDETSNTQNTHHTKKSLKEGFLKTLLTGGSLLKTLFERNNSKDSFESNNKKTQKMDVKSTQSIQNEQQTQTTEKKKLENKTENTLKNKIGSIFHIFK